MASGSYLKTEIHRKNLSIALKGKKKSREHIRKLKKAMIGISVGRKHPPRTKKWRKEASEWMKNRLGENSPNWKGGISKVEGYHSLYGSRHRARKKEASGSHTSSEWKGLKLRYEFTCPGCHRSEPEIKLTEDHVIPLSRGGSDYITNIQPLCKSCNSKKHAKTIEFKVN